MQSLLFDGPATAAVPADTKPDRRRRDYRVGMNRVPADFMDVTVDVYGGLPGHTAVGGARNAPDMNIG